MDIILQLLGVFVLGLIGGATPGPILTSVFTEILHKGFLKSLEIVFEALLSEVIVATGILLIFFSFNIPHVVFSIISLVGSAILFLLAFQVWKIKELNSKGKIFSFKKIFLLTVFNSQLWIFWITICVPQAFQLSKKITGGQFLFLLFFEAGWFLATTSLGYGFSHFRKFLTKGEFMHIVFKIFAILLVFFAIKLIIESGIVLSKF